MKTNLFNLCVIAVAAIALAACSFSTANMSSFKTSKDPDGKQEASTFKTGETIYANAVISNAGEKVTVKMYLTSDDAAKKDEPVPGSEVKVDLPGSGTAKYSLSVPEGMKGGKFTVVAEMLNENGEKKDGKTAAITIETVAAAPAGTRKADKPASKDDKEDKDDKDSDTSDDDDS